MAMAQPKALVNPRLLRWARETAGYSLTHAALAMKRAPSDLDSWEKGAAQPSIPQARKLAELYKRSLAVFYLPTPPKESDLPPDYRRTRQGVPLAELAPKIRWRVR